MQTMVAVILAGGVGSRLWPLSNKNLPKQFLPLISSGTARRAPTLFQETFARVANYNNLPVITVCNKSHKNLVMQQVKQLGGQIKQIAIEPVGRNTAPCIAVLALHYLAAGSDPLLFVVPSDHYIADTDKFYAAVDIACQYAEQGNLIAFGVKPDKAETGYGYIKFNSAYKIERFTEKPDYKTAQKFLSSGKYYWNSGMFMFRASVFIEELKKYAPDIFTHCQLAAKNIQRNRKILNFPEREFSNCPSNSIDYAIMEHTKKGIMVPLNAKWSDLGTWSALLEHGKNDQQNNLIKGDVILKNVTNSCVHANSRKIVAIGVRDHIIVETKDAVLIMHKDHCQDLKNVIDGV